jgi:trans-aconitate 2-methyltransferase
MPWDPDQYLRFADHRTRPGVELLARIPNLDPRRIMDLGCGTGHLTAMLQHRWPSANVTGIDSSVEMIEQARLDHPDMQWVVEDVAAWEPDGEMDLIYSNAALHWLDDHEALFNRLRSFLSPGGVFAAQIPDNWNAPTHRVPADVLDEGEWPETARKALMRDRLSPPVDYVRWLQPARVDLWRTTYYQQLTGDDPVWNWVTGSVLRPVLAALDVPDRDRFEEIAKARYQEAYPAGPSGVTTLPFSRLFMVAQTTGTRKAPPVPSPNS